LPYRWFLEMRQVYAEEMPSPEIRMACASCHAFARPQTWRRTPTEWKLLVNMHIGYFPVSEYNSFHARPRPDGYGILPASQTPRQPTSQSADSDLVGRALEYLNKNNGLHSAAWSKWRAALEDPNLKGRWVLTASAPGKGKYYGTMIISPGDVPDLFKSEAALVGVADRSKTSFLGRAIVYTGYEWRGSSDAAGIGTVRQVMMISADQSKIEGRWFWGGYQEFGLNVSARRASTDVTVLGTDVSSIHAGSRDVPVEIIGENFPVGLSTTDIEMGAGVHVKKIVAIKPEQISVLVDVDSNVITGFRSVSVKSRATPDALAVYDKIDYIKISDESALAHLGGAGHPKGYIQFEAVGYNRGLDGVANTADDINLGPVPVKWSIEEFISHFNDNDREFVGFINSDGLFTPAPEGPNPQRRFMTNNTGDVWVVAKYQDKDSPEHPLVAKSYLVVTVPSYVKWDEPEVAQ